MGAFFHNKPKSSSDECFIWDEKFPASELVGDPIFVRGEFVANVGRLIEVIVLEKNRFVNGNEKTTGFKCKPAYLILNIEYFIWLKNV
ncbi:MAG: hypothetical protein QMB78_06435 [Rhodospirillales bacterium]